MAIISPTGLNILAQGRAQRRPDENCVFQLINGVSTNPMRKRGKVSSPRLRVGLVFSSGQPAAA